MNDTWDYIRGWTVSELILKSQRHMSLLRPHTEGSEIYKYKEKIMDCTYDKILKV